MGDTVMSLLEQTGAVLKGHFLLSSGRHSGGYVQCAKLLRFPDKAAAVLAEAIKKIENLPDVVVGPAIGGINVSYEVARQLGVESLFTERVDNVMQLRRGFEIQNGAKVLITEDVLTTGRSAKEAIEAIRPFEVEIVGVLCIVDRMMGHNPFDAPLYSAATLDIETYEADACPLCKAGGRPVKPGSRKF